MVQWKKDMEQWEWGKAGGVAMESDEREGNWTGGRRETMEWLWCMGGHWTGRKGLMWTVLGVVWVDGNGREA